MGADAIIDGLISDLYSAIKQHDIKRARAILYLLKLCVDELE